MILSAIPAETKPAEAESIRRGTFVDSEGNIDPTATVSTSGELPSPREGKGTEGLISESSASEIPAGIAVIL